MSSTPEDVARQIASSGLPFSEAAKLYGIPRQKLYYQVRKLRKLGVPVKIADERTWRQKHWHGSIVRKKTITRRGRREVLLSLEPMGLADEEYVSVYYLDGLMIISDELTLANMKKVGLRSWFADVGNE